MIAFLVILFIVSPVFPSDLPLIETPLGVLQGLWKTSYNGRRFQSFEGIPYALPPVGNHRFSAPKLVKPWKGIWNATNVYTCAQVDINSNIVGTNDCLYLNIYIPETGKKGLDVIVHFHPGAFNFGSGHEYGHPQYLMDRDVIFVAINYRLGIFGFLSTADALLPGNNGLKDQVVALKWLKYNILSFGGNPNSITITGISAGAASVHFHYLTPFSDGLFHRGISHSGVATNVWAVIDDPMDNTKRLANLVGCPVNGSEILVSCIKSRSTQQLLEGVVRMLTATEAINFVPFGPVVDNNFLPEHPYKLLKEGKVKDLPWIVSNVKDEGIYAMFLAGKKIRNNFKNNVDEKALVEKIKHDYYPGIKEIPLNSMKDLIDYTSHLLFFCDAIQTGKMQSKVVKSPVYYYLLSYEGENSHSQILTSDGQKYPGVCHVDDAFYMFAKAIPVAVDKLNNDDLQMKEAFLDMLQSFAKTGVPKFPNVNWKPVSQEFTVLNITGINSNMRLINLKGSSPIGQENSCNFLNSRLKQF